MIAYFEPGTCISDHTPGLDTLQDLYKRSPRDFPKMVIAYTRGGVGTVTDVNCVAGKSVLVIPDFRDVQNPTRTVSNRPPRFPGAVLANPNLQNQAVSAF